MRMFWEAGVEASPIWMVPPVTLCVVEEIRMSLVKLEDDLRTTIVPPLIVKGTTLFSSSAARAVLVDPAVFIVITPPV